MKLRNLAMILGFGLSTLFGNPFANAQTINKNSTKKQNVKLSPFIGRGNIHPHYDALTTKHVLGSSFSVADGSFYLEGMGSFNIKTGKKSDAFIEYADPESVIKRFQELNTELKSDSLRAHLQPYTPFPRELSYIFADGKVMDESELNVVNQLEKKNYLFTYLYKSDGYNDNKIPLEDKASLPGIMVIEQDGDNFKFKRPDTTTQTPYITKADGSEENTGTGKRDCNEEKSKTRFRLEAGAGTNKQIVGGAFLSIPVFSCLSIGGYGLGYFAGDPVRTCHYRKDHSYSF